MESYWRDRLSEAQDTYESLRNESTRLQGSLQKQLAQQQELLKNETQSWETKLSQLLQSQGVAAYVKSLEEARDMLEAELNEMSDRFVKESMDMEDAYERQQDEHTKEVKRLKEELMLVRNEARANITALKQQAEAEKQEIRADLMEQLSLKDISLEELEISLNITEQALQESEETVIRLETERESVRGLTRASWRLVRGRIGNRVSRVLGKRRR
jgi:hypothetical protein